MSRESLRTINSLNSGPSNTTEKKRKGSLRRSSFGSKSGEKRKVSFQDEVSVRFIEEEQQIQQVSKLGVFEPEEDDSSDSSGDDNESLTKVNPNYRVKETPGRVGSLDDLCDEILSDIQETDEETVHPSTSTASINNSPSSPMDLLEEYPEMDVYMRLTYPKYYHFLKSHIITGAIGSEDYRAQQKEFEEAIILCRQYPPEYFDDLEQTLEVYESMYTNGKTSRKSGKK